MSRGTAGEDHHGPRRQSERFCSIRDLVFPLQRSHPCTGRVGASRRLRMASAAGWQCVGSELPLDCALLGSVQQNDLLDILDLGKKIGSSKHLRYSTLPRMMFATSPINRYLSTMSRIITKNMAL
ncbi:uncharacterized protein LOC121593007 [Anopheles merus]|uniref:uncharacterized protein LOC121593007 n=1 Tax=Anopheles merus TaxID=30066 RepID=UPI001BE403DE|nr:uncharacterized protein LOC121593007 [Anopheles merus]XP_041770957.1 uncharacterized protein LOC121593007 [Anopheles merus]